RGGGAEARAAQGHVPNGLHRHGIGVAEDERPPRHDPVEETPPVGRLDVCPRSALDEERLVEPAPTHGAHRRGHAARDQLQRAAGEGPGPRPSHARGSRGPQPTSRSAPARLIAVSDSSAAVRSSSQPARAAALTIAYSPETLYAASGAWNASRAARITSRYGSAGLIMIASAPSARSILHSRRASRTLAGSTS